MSNALPKGIRKRGNSYIVDVSYKGERKTATCVSLSEAKVKRTALLADLHTGRDTGPDRRSNARVWTLQEALDKTLELAAPDGWRGCSYEKQATLNAEDAINYMGPARSLDAIDFELINAWCRDCEGRGNSNATINRKLSALSKLFTVAHRLGGIAYKPEMPKLRKERVGRIRQISSDEERELLAYLKVIDTDAHDAVALLIDTGMRCGELLNQRWEDISFETGTMLIYGQEGKGTKDGKYRSVYMTERVKTILKARHMLSIRHPMEMSYSKLRRAWDGARSHLGLAEDKDFTIHVCRHTCASRLVSRGVPLIVVQQWLGHSNIQTTMRYAHLYPKELEQAVKALEMY